MWHVLAHGKALACTLDPAYPWLAASTCIHRISAACYSSALTAIINPIKGPRAIPKSTNSTVASFFPHFFLLYLLLSFVLSCCFLLLFADSVTRNGIAIAPSELVRLREWSICRATRFELSLFAVLLAGVARELFNLLPCCSFENVFWD